jgi:hypothetical protein
MMEDLFKQVYETRASINYKLSCLALHPDGTVTTLSKALVYELSDDMRKRDCYCEAGSIAALNDYGYRLTMFFSCHTNTDPKNEFATNFHRACKTADSFLTHGYNTIMLRGSVYLLDDHKDLTMTDWKFIKHCWRSQDEKVKRQWYAVRQSCRSASPILLGGKLSDKLAAVQAAMTVSSAVYFPANNGDCFEFPLSSK